MTQSEPPRLQLLGKEGGNFYMLQAMTKNNHSTPPPLVVYVRHVQMSTK